MTELHDIRPDGRPYSLREAMWRVECHRRDIDLQRRAGHSSVCDDL
jgi:hypothetical protein